jgi:AcrR family transcriptional regulator
MPTPRNPTRQRLIQAALELFTANGVTDTTTKQIAELADVNEVTLFRHFGNKHGLLLAAIEEAAVFTELGKALVERVNQADDIDQALKEYAIACLEALEQVPEMVRSVVGEAGQYPTENREALGRGLTQANRYVAEYFDRVINRRQMQANIPAESLASLLNGMLLGYAVIEFTSEFHELWQSRDEFLTNLVTLFLQGAIQPTNSEAVEVRDLPADTVHLILQKAKKQGIQDYAIAYVIFGAGLNAKEITELTRSDYHSKQLQTATRQVPLNQWILGKRYGSYTKNPLTQWLKIRKDSLPAMFLIAENEPITEAEILQRWNHWSEEILNKPTIEQAYQNWCVDLLIRGITIADLKILTQQNEAQLQPFVNRAREKLALEQAIRLDQPPRSSAK